MTNTIINEINLCRNENGSVTVWAAAVTSPYYLLHVDEDFDDAEAAWRYADWLSEMTGVLPDDFFMHYQED